MRLPPTDDDPEVVRAIRSGILGRIAVTYFEWAADGWQVPVLDWLQALRRRDKKVYAKCVAAIPRASAAVSWGGSAARTSRGSALIGSS